MKIEPPVLRSLAVITSTGLVGTSFMTLFSFTLSAIEDKRLTEPEILTTLIHRIRMVSTRRSNVLPGWVAHYAMGLLFSAIYVKLWESQKLRPNLKNALLLGSVSAVMGLLIWKLTIELHPDPPALDYNTYYKQLIPAHFVFAAGFTLAYRMLRQIERGEQPNKKSAN